MSNVPKEDSAVYVRNDDDTLTKTADKKPRKQRSDKGKARGPRKPKATQQTEN